MESSIYTIITFQTFSGLQIVQIWSMNYALHYNLEESRYENIVDIGVHLILTYIERLFSIV